MNTAHFHTHYRSPVRASVKPPRFVSKPDHDFYPTPPEAVHALLSVERFDGPIWEPACGDGAISKVLEATSHTVHSTDLIDRGYGEGGQDFLSTITTTRVALEHPELKHIVTNPPYKHARAFVERAVEFCPRVMMLLRFSFYESISRGSILDTGTLARVHCFRKRLPMMHRHGWTGPTAASGMAFAWFVWDRSHRGGTILDRLSWEDYADSEPSPALAQAAE